MGLLARTVPAPGTTPVVVFDGGWSRKSGGVCGAVLFSGSEVVDARRKVLGKECRSCNVAEYEGLLLAMEMALVHGVRGRLRVKGDSMLVIMQVSGRWKFKHSQHLKPMAEAARAVAAKIGGVSFSWHRRSSEMARAAHRVAEGVEELTTC